MQPIRMAIIGGKPGAFIGDAHRKAALLSEEIRIVAGCFSRDGETNRAAGERLNLPAERVYATWQELIESEATLPAAQRAQLISSVTPNQLHAPVAIAAMKAGFDVISDKPLSYSLAEAQELLEVVEDTGRVFTMTHNYTGYPLVKHARQMIASGELGAVRKVVVEYPQGGVGGRMGKLAPGEEPPAGLVDPMKRTEKSGAMGDIGTHAEHLARYITGLQIDELCADATTIVPGREIEDDGNVLIRYVGGARGVLFASQISVGEENPLRIRVYTEQAGLEWRQMDPNTLIVRWRDRPAEQLRAGKVASAQAKAATFMPAGHPEGYIEAFAQLYGKTARRIRAHAEGREPDPLDLDTPSVYDGYLGMAFLDAVHRSAHSAGKWTSFAQPD